LHAVANSLFLFADRIRVNARLLAVPVPAEGRTYGRANVRALLHLLQFMYVASCLSKNAEGYTPRQPQTTFSATGAATRCCNPQPQHQQLLQTPPPPGRAGATAAAAATSTTATQTAGTLPACARCVSGACFTACRGRPPWLLVRPWLLGPCWPLPSLP
jgi:hypothetical protein